VRRVCGQQFARSYEPGKAAERLLAKLRPFTGTILAHAEHCSCSPERERDRRVAIRIAGNRRTRRDVVIRIAGNRRTRRDVVTRIAGNRRLAGNVAKRIARHSFRGSRVAKRIAGNRLHRPYAQRGDLQS
jgi:hypothetical protein